MSGTSQADEMFDWESLVAAGRKNVAQLPDVETVLAPLLGVIDEVKALRVHQKDLEGNRQATTQQLKELRLRGVEEARRLRDYIAHVWARRTSSSCSSASRLSGGGPAGRRPSSRRRKSRTRRRRCEVKGSKA